jgi:hypothetical protein
MREHAAEILFAATASLTLAAGALLALGPATDDGRAARGREFQRLVGGLGLGADVDLSQCGQSFDPRTGALCDSACGPLAEGRFYCPRHNTSVFVVDPLAGRSLSTEAHGNVR